MPAKRTFTKNKKTPVEAATATSVPEEGPKEEDVAEGEVQTQDAVEDSEAESETPINDRDETDSSKADDVTSEPTQVSDPVDEAAPSDKDSSGMVKWLIIFIIFILLLGVVAYVSYQFGLSQANGNPGKNVEQQDESAPSPSPTEEASANLSAYSITVLNGSGITGEASTLQKSLDAAGFKVEAIGNADEDVDKTIIKAKKSVPSSFTDQLTEELSKTYVLDDSEVLKSSSEEDVVIIIGSTKEEE